MYVTMKLPFVSSREGQDGERSEPEQIQNNTNISAMQIGYGPPVPGGHSPAADGPSAIKAKSGKARRTRSKQSKASS